MYELDREARVLPPIKRQKREPMAFQTVEAVVSAATWFSNSTKASTL